MKALNNPFVAGTLAVAACTFFAWNVVGPIWTRHRGSSAPTPEAPPSTPAAPLGPPTAAAVVKPVPTGETNYAAMDLAAIQSQLPRWLEAPRRDPFEVVVQAKVAVKQEGPRAEDVLKLHAIWRQSGHQLAVVNQQIVTEGDPVAGYLVQRIENDFITVQGSNGLERVEYRAPTLPAPPTPVVPASTSQPRVSPQTNTPSAKPTQTVLRPANIPT